MSSAAAAAARTHSPTHSHQPHNVCVPRAAHPSLARRVYWQAFDSDPDWTLITNSIPTSTTLGSPVPKFYVLAQYSRHVRPGMTIINATDSQGGTTVAAYSPADKKLVLVTTNLATRSTTVTFDLSAFSNIAQGSATRWVTVMASSGDKYAAYTDVAVSGTTAVATMEGNSVTTIEIDGVVA